MTKRIFALLLVTVMLLGALPLALAEGEHDHGVEPRVSAYCPVCGMLLYYRYYSVTRDGSGLVCYVEETYEQPYCNLHGNVYSAAVADTHEFFHEWKTDFLTGKPKCTKCGEYDQTRSVDLICENASTDHRWLTNYTSGRAECSLCGLIDVGELSDADMVCPSHKTFHTWVTNEETGAPICYTCGSGAKFGTATE